MKMLTIGGAVIAAGLAIAAPFAQAQFDDSPAAPKLESASDVAVQEAVQHALDSDKRMRGAVLSVSVYQGRISVSGEVADSAQYAQAEQIARKVAPGHQVTTLLEAMGD